MSLFQNILCRLGYRSESKRPARKRRLILEGLENRELFATLAVLDFNGVSDAEVAALQAAIPNHALRDTGVGEKSFIGEFATLQAEGYAQYSFLDFDNNGRLDAIDGERAARQITSKVREDFAPYDLDVIREDNTERGIALVSDNAGNDTLVVVSGEHTNPGGAAPLDIGNRNDSLAGAGGSVGIARFVVGSGLTGNAARSAFIAMAANFISHELGHSFGLAHIDLDVHPNPVSLMNHFQGFENNCFEDRSFSTETSGVQNPHRILLQTLGASTRPWAAVLRPGTLTIQGSESSDSLLVVPRADGGWDVQAGTSAYFVHPMLRYDFSSINPFQATPIINVVVLGGAGNDFISVGGAGSGVTAFINAGRGDDIVYGHAGRDNMWGDQGNDILIGMDGNDVLYGGDDRDILIGGRGTDKLYGEGGEDLLIGGDTTLTKGLGSLNDLRSKWTSNSAYFARTASVLSALSGTLTDDNVRDEIFGGNGLDLVLCGWEDLLDTYSELAIRVP